MNFGDLLLLSLSLMFIFIYLSIYLLHLFRFYPVFHSLLTRKLEENVRYPKMKCSLLKHAQGETFLDIICFSINSVIGGMIE